MKLGVKAGILGGATTTDGKSIPTYAACNEFGTSRIPPRPFLRQTAEENIGKWVGQIAAQTANEPWNRDAWVRGVTLAGESMKADIRYTIQNGNFVPNAPSTVAIKKAKGKVEPDHPLIDTGQMLAAVSYEVMKG